MNKHLHIVSFDVPYPADYGGVSDVFYKIKALNNAGVKIHLHCFKYGRSEATELTKYCTEVKYYKRKTGLSGLSITLPYIVNSRANDELLQRLLQDDYPVLLEGIHCTYFLYNNQLKNKKVFVRLHNVEFEYYRQLEKNESSLLKNIYYKNESRLLKNYENKIADQAFLLSLSKKDIATYKEKFGANNIKYLPAFVSDEGHNIKEGNGSYCLYHGNLSVTENEKAAIWLVQNIFSKVNIPFVIAGKNPSKKLIKLVNSYRNASIIMNPPKDKMNELITNAQINILPSFNSTGIKIKLLNALFSGRHCIVNKAIIDGSGLESLCHIANSQDEYLNLIQRLFKEPFTKINIEERFENLKGFNNETNAKHLMQLIY